MSIPQSQLAPWTRKHDKPGVPLFPQAPVIVFPQSLEDVIQICSTRLPGQRLRAAGSHWALSSAAVSDHVFIETHDFNEVFPAMGRTLFEVVPACLSDKFLLALNAQSQRSGAQEYFVHFESGKRIYQLYAELDVGDSQIPQSLSGLMQSRFGNTALTGSWGFATLGGAGGQTVVGALSTGTHGGDFDRPPVSDSVVALHVVADGGKHYWIERSHNDGEPPFTDETKLRALYGQAKFGGPGNFEIIYNDQVWRAAIVQVGRFGAVYSAVLRVLPQYGLREQLVLSDWETVRSQIADATSSLFTPLSGESPHHFLQIAVNPIPSTNGATHLCGITKHWTLPLDQVDLSTMPPVTWGGGRNVAGRPERVGNIVAPFDPTLNAPRFSMAGTGVPWSPDDSGITSFSLLDSACSDANFMDGVVSGIYTEIENFLSSNAVPIGGALAGAIAVGLGDTLLALAPWLLAILAILALFLQALRNDGSTMGQALNNLRNSLLGSNDPNQRAAGILVWRAIAAQAFKSQQAPHDYKAISYAIFDGHAYNDVSCAVNVRSVEVFFDAADPNLIAFVDRLLQFEANQEFQAGKSVVGYISLRFCMSSQGLIAPEAFPRTCAVECSGLADDAGSTEFVNFAVALAQDPNIKGVLHWGQQNSSTQSQIEFRFGDTPGSPSGPLNAWRATLSMLTANGRLDGFSSLFTRTAGLEIVQPRIVSFTVATAPTAGNSNCTLAWDCRDNPSGTTASLEIIPPSGGATLIPSLPLQGTHTFSAAQSGTFVALLRASLTLNGETRNANQTLRITGV